MRNVRRKHVENNKKTRSLIYTTVGILVLIYLTVNLIAGENGLMRYIELNSTRNKFHAETVAIKSQVDDISKQMEVLKKEPQLLEESAREYGLTREGELIFKFEDKE